MAGIKRIVIDLRDADAWRPRSFRVLWRYAAGRETNSRAGYTPSDHIRAAASWLARAQDATADGGVVGRYRLKGGWTSSYPETTGYLIPTLLQLSRLPGLGDFEERAARAVQFLLEMQLPGGAFPGGEIHENVTEPSVFNTAQIIAGLLAWHEHAGDDRTLAAATAAGDWMVSLQEPDGAWRRYCYNTLATTYSAHAACWLAAMGHRLGVARYLESAHRHLLWTLAHVDPETGWFDLAGFTEDQHAERTAFTHTIGYTLWGTLVSAQILDEPRAVKAVENAAGGVAATLDRLGWLPGVLDHRWSGRSSYACVTGTAQMAQVWGRLATLTHSREHLAAARRAIAGVRAAQMMNSSNPDIHGALPGSDPIWGDYIRLAFPNWAAKFFLDVLLMPDAGGGGPDGAA